MSSNEKQLLVAESQAPGRLTLPALVLARFITMIPLLIAGFLLIDIGTTFGRPVGVTGQIQSVASVVAAVTAILLGIGSLRYSHKSLLLLGISALCISAVGCFLAPSFAILIIVYALSGLGTAIIMPMGLTLVATHLSLEQRASAIGWLTASPALAAIIGSPLITALAGLGDWRWVFLGLGFTISFLSLLLAYFGVPTSNRSLHPTQSQMRYGEAFKAVFTNRSALACLAGTALIIGAFAANQVFFQSFVREQFLISIGFTAVLFTIGSVSFVVGSISSGNLIARFGRKPVTTVTAFLMGGFIIIYMNMPNLWLVVGFGTLSGFFGGLVVAASSGLTLEQIPQYRGTMMSMHYTLWSLGTALGTGVGGVALLSYDYGMLGLALGSFSLIATFIFHFGAIDLTQEDST